MPPWPVLNRGHAPLMRTGAWRRKRLRIVAAEQEWAALRRSDRRLQPTAAAALPRPNIDALGPATLPAGFILVCVLVALDLALTNIAVSLLAVAIQQCIVATNPAFTVSIESIVRRKLAHPMIYLVIVFLCTGPIVAQARQTTAFHATFPACALRPHAIRPASRPALQQAF